MAFVPFHSIDSSSDGTEIELIAAGENVSSVKSVLLTNTDDGDLNVSLYIQDSQTGNKYYMLYLVLLPQASSLLLDSDDMLAFNNSSTGYYNTAVGRSAGTSVTTAYYNTFYGASAGDHVTEGVNNVCVGYQAGNTTHVCLCSCSMDNAGSVFVWSRHQRMV